MFRLAATNRTRSRTRNSRISSRFWTKCFIGPEATASPKESSILVGDLNVAPHENDVWSHKALLPVVSHTPIETDKLKSIIAQGSWIDTLRRYHADRAKALHVVELSLAGLGQGGQGTPARPYLGVTGAGPAPRWHRHPPGSAWLGTAVRPRSGQFAIAFLKLGRDSVRPPSLRQLCMTCRTCSSSCPKCSIS